MTRKRRLLAIGAALAAYYVLGAALTWLSLPISGWLYEPLNRAWSSLTPLLGDHASTIVLVLLLATPPALVALLVYGALARRSPPDEHLHCRRCNYILHGLTEPRCPECGESI